MAPSNERVIVNEMMKNGGGSSEVDSKKSNLLFLCLMSGKKVCRYCKREFKSGRALGGHIRLHYKNIREKNVATLQPSAAPSIATIMHRTKGDNHDDVIDLSKSLSGLGWRVQKKRGGVSEGNNKRKKVIASVSQCYDDGDDSSFDEDANDDEDDRMLRERLKSYGTAHKICRTRRLYRCKVCDMVFPTIHAVLCHVNESSTTENDDDDEGKVEEKKEKGKGEGKGKKVISEDGSVEVDQLVAGGNKKVVAEVTSTSGGGGGGGFMDQDVSPSVPPKMVDFDLNEIPAQEEN